MSDFKNSIECPYCQQEYKSLVRHIPYIHKVSMDTARKEFPGLKVQIGKKDENSYRENEKRFSEEYEKYKGDEGYECPECKKIFKSISGLQEHCLSHGMRLPSRKDFLAAAFEKEEFKCELCERNFKDFRGLQVHRRMKHKDVYPFSSSEKEHRESSGFECPICHKFYKGFADHIRSTHLISWETFVKEYSWEKGGSYFSPEHRKKLSANKKAFYESARGKKLREIQSKKTAGNNIFQDPGSNIDSYYFYWEENGIKKMLRSYQEYSVDYYLKKYNIDFSYESEIIFYVLDGVQHIYTPDLKIGNSYYEIKSDEKSFTNDRKYTAIQKTLESTPFKLELLLTKTCYDKFGFEFPDSIEIGNSIKNNFFKNETFFISGYFNHAYEKGKEMPLLKKAFGKEYFKFVEENLKRIKNYETKKHKKD